MKKLLSVLLICGLSFVALAFNGPGDRNEPQFEGMKLLKLQEFIIKLDLSDDQKTDIADILKSHAGEIRPLVQEVIEARKDLHEQVLAETPDEELITEAAGKLGKSQGELAVKASQLINEIRTVLTDEQIDHLQKTKENVKKTVDAKRELIKQLVQMWIRNNSSI